MPSSSFFICKKYTWSYIHKCNIQLLAFLDLKNAFERVFVEMEKSKWLVVTVTVMYSDAR